MLARVRSARPLFLLHRCQRAAHSSRPPVDSDKVPPKVQEERDSLKDTKLVDVKEPDTESLADKASRAAQEVVSHVGATLKGVRDQVLRGGSSLGEHRPGNKHQDE